jgi:hypothetical protein
LERVRGVNGISALKGSGGKGKSRDGMERDEVGTNRLRGFYITLCKCKIYLVKYDTNLIEYV